MYIFEISDILFLIKNLKNPTNNFNVNNCVSFSTSTTKSCGIKLRHNTRAKTKEYHFISIELVACGTLYQLLILVYPSAQLKNALNTISGNTLL